MSEPFNPFVSTLYQAPYEDPGWTRIRAEFEALCPIPAPVRPTNFDTTAPYPFPMPVWPTNFVTTAPYPIPMPVRPTNFDTTSAWTEDDQYSQNIFAASRQNPTEMHDLRALNTGPQIPTGLTPYRNFLAIYNAPTAGDEELAENYNGPVPLTTLPGEPLIAHARVDAGEHADTRLRGAQKRRKRPAKYRCHDDDCGQTFTSTYRLNTHRNRFHTPLHLQRRYSCPHCGVYDTPYACDLKRHRRSCVQDGAHILLPA